MPPTPGDRMGPYTIAEKIGEGGMGEVYRATDNNLKRDVAIKFLPEGFTQDPERLARFQREAEVLAQLHHPNIASIFGIEESGGARALVMELVEGPTLAERLFQSRLTIDEALDIAKQIAVALEEAHIKGIVHRDLKPANVKLAPEGRVKVLDFGLAKALDSTADLSGASPDTLARSPTLTAASTQLGVILGTAAYMSPEQARGEPVDKRADVWAFGCVLFEMLTGRMTFKENTVSDTLASVLKIEPDWSLLPADVPHNLRRLLTRCLRKDPKQRQHDIADARIEIEETLATPPDKRAVAPAAGPRSRMSPIIVFILVAAALTVGLIVGQRLGPGAPDRTVRRFFLPVEPKDNSETVWTQELSPDGRMIVYEIDNQLWLHDLEQGTTRAIAGTEGGDMPFWSPDGEQIGFRKDDSLWRIPIGGGQASLIIGEAPPYHPPSWGEDGTVVFSAMEEIRAVPARGGESTLMLAFNPAVEQHFHDVHLLPDGRGLLFVPHLRGDGGFETIELLDAGERRVLLNLKGSNIQMPTYSPTGHLLFHRSAPIEGLWAVPFSLAKVKPVGEPFLVVPNATNGSVGPDGTLIYTDARAGGDVELVWFDAEGTILGSLGEPQADMSGPAISPDGTKVAVIGKEDDESDIWIHDETGNKERITFDHGAEQLPRWSRDGALVFYSHPEDDPDASIYRVDSGAGGQRELLGSGLQAWVRQDNAQILVQRVGEGTHGDLWSLSLEGNAEPDLILGTEADEGFPALSPNGRFLSYSSDESGTHQVYIRPFPTGTDQWQVSTRHGWLSYWSPSGDRLYYHSYDRLMVVQVSTEPVLRLGTPRIFIDPGQTTLQLDRGTDIAGDGRRFVGVSLVETEEADRVEVGIHVVLNWFADFAD